MLIATDRIDRITDIRQPSNQIYERTYYFQFQDKVCNYQPEAH